jgi:hypothetical protein
LWQDAILKNNFSVFRGHPLVARVLREIPASSGPGEDDLLAYKEIKPLRSPLLIDQRRNVILAGKEQPERCSPAILRVPE